MASRHIFLVGEFVLQPIVFWISDETTSLTVLPGDVLSREADVEEPLTSTRRSFSAARTGVFTCLRRGGNLSTNSAVAHDDYADTR